MSEKHGGMQGYLDEQREAARALLAALKALVEHGTDSPEHRAAEAAIEAAKAAGIE